MNEGIFYGFDDLTDEYDYGRDVFKEDIYEFHSNMEMNFITDYLSYIPGIFSSEEVSEDLGSYLKYGRKCGNIIKYQIKITTNKKVIFIIICFRLKQLKLQKSMKHHLTKTRTLTSMVL